MSDVEEKLAAGRAAEAAEAAAYRRVARAEALLGPVLNALVVARVRGTLDAGEKSRLGREAVGIALAAVDALDEVGA